MGFYFSATMAARSLGRHVRVFARVDLAAVREDVNRTSAKPRAPRRRKDLAGRIEEAPTHASWDFRTSVAA